jgi:hypothetical protein
VSHSGKISTSEFRFSLRIIRQRGVGPRCDLESISKYDLRELSDTKSAKPKLGKLEIWPGKARRPLVLDNANHREL